MTDPERTTVSELRTSIPPTYDGAKTGPRYWISTFVNGRPLGWEEPIEDPFITTTIHVGWRDLVKHVLLRKPLEVRVQVGGDRDVIEDVLELNGDYLGFNCSRRREFNGQLGAALARHADGEEFREITRRLSPESEADHG